MTTAFTQNLVLLVSAFVMLFMIIMCSGHNKLESFKPDKCFYGPSDVLQRQMSYLNCTNECRSRSTCVAISVYTRMSLCYLHFDSGYAPITCPMYMFSEKRDWHEKTIEGCESTTCSQNNQKCEIMDGLPSCIKRECLQIKSLVHGTIYGNDVRIGKKVSFACNSGYSLIGSSSLVCEENGQWNDTVPVCAAINAAPINNEQHNEPAGPTSALAGVGTQNSETISTPETSTTTPTTTTTTPTTTPTTTTPTTSITTPTTSTTTLTTITTTTSSTSTSTPTTTTTTPTTTTTSTSTTTPITPTTTPTTTTTSTTTPTTSTTTPTTTTTSPTTTSTTSTTSPTTTTLTTTTPTNTSTTTSATTTTPTTTVRSQGTNDEKADQTTTAQRIEHVDDTLGFPLETVITDHLDYVLSLDTREADIASGASENDSGNDAADSSQTTPAPSPSQTTTTASISSQATTTTTTTSTTASSTATTTTNATSNPATVTTTTSPTSTTSTTTPTTTSTTATTTHTNTTPTAITTTNSPTTTSTTSTTTTTTPTTTTSTTSTTTSTLLTTTASTTTVTPTTTTTTTTTTTPTTTTVASLQYDDECGRHEPCPQSSNLTCRLGKCRCTYGFVYSSQTNSCGKDCPGDAYGDTFQTFVSKGIPETVQDNMDQITRLDSMTHNSECLNNCTANGYCNVVVTMRYKSKFQCSFFHGELTEFDQQSWTVEYDKNVSFRNCAADRGGLAFD